jgi:NADH:ubiquinone oxidoreductase subunit H
MQIDLMCAYSKLVMWVLEMMCPYECTVLLTVITLTLFIGYWNAVICSTLQMHCTFLKYLTLFDCCEHKRHHCFGEIRQTPGKILGKETKIYIVLTLNAQFINYL